MQTPEDLSDLVQRIDSAKQSPAIRTSGPELRRRPERAWRRRRALIGGIVVAAAVLGGGTAAWAGIAAANRDATTAEPAPEPAPEEVESAEGGTPTTEPKPETPEPEETVEAPAEEPAATAEPEQAPQSKWSIDDPNSLQVVVNKQRPLAPLEFEPTDLVLPQGIANQNGQPMRAEAAGALERMYADASAAGMPFVITSAYRGYAMQVGLFDSYVARDGLEAAETYSARAGHSEHQTGLAADLDDGSGCAFESCFGETPTGLWLRENAWQYGFILRYDQGQDPVVGYIYEPWHFRYIGTEISTDMHERGIVNLEEYFGLPAAPTY